MALNETSTRFNSRGIIITTFSQLILCNTNCWYPSAPRVLFQLLRPAWPILFDMQPTGRDQSAEIFTWGILIRNCHSETPVIVFIWQHQYSHCDLVTIYAHKMQSQWISLDIFKIQWNIILFLRLQWGITEIMYNTMSLNLRKSV